MLLMDDFIPKMASAHVAKYCFSSAAVDTQTPLRLGKTRDRCLVKEGNW